MTTWRMLRIGSRSVFIAVAADFTVLDVAVVVVCVAFVVVAADVTVIAVVVVVVVFEPGLQA